jgi:hypothetical protein
MKSLIIAAALLAVSALSGCAVGAHGSVLGASASVELGITYHFDRDRNLYYHEKDGQRHYMPGGWKPSGY